MKIPCIAVDDEPLALDIISDYANKVPYLNLLETFCNPLEALDYLKNNRIDLIFLDIQMDMLSGVQLLNVLKDKPLVIFTTAYDSYAIQGYELDAIDYLLKPVSFERFLRATDKAFDRLNIRKTEAEINPQPSSTISNTNYIFVKSDSQLIKLNFSDIYYIEGMGDYLKIKLKNKSIVTLQNFKKLEEALPVSQFCRVHKSYMVSIDKIESIEKNRIQILDQLIPISETYKKQFYILIDHLGA